MVPFPLITTPRPLRPLCSNFGGSDCAPRTRFSHSVPMPASPILSIVIVACKSRDEIADCLRSMPAVLEGRPVEIVVVDNSPGDGAGELIRRDCPAVAYWPAERNLGFGRANNLGYARTAGEFVLFLNPDAIANAAALAHCLARLRADAMIGLISPRLVQANGAMDLACRRSIPNLWDGFCRASGLASAFPGQALFAGYNPHAPAGARHLRGRGHQRSVHAGTTPDAGAGRAGSSGVQ